MLEGINFAEILRFSVVKIFTGRIICLVCADLLILVWLPHGFVALRAIVLKLSDRPFESILLGLNGLMKNRGLTLSVGILLRIGSRLIVDLLSARHGIIGLILLIKSALTVKALG